MKIIDNVLDTIGFLIAVIATYFILALFSGNLAYSQEAPTKCMTLETQIQWVQGMGGKITSGPTMFFLLDGSGKARVIPWNTYFIEFSDGSSVVAFELKDTLCMVPDMTVVYMTPEDASKIKQMIASQKDA